MARETTSPEGTTGASAGSSPAQSEPMPKPAGRPLDGRPVGLWTEALDHVPASRADELAAEIDSLGYGAIWLPEVAGREIFVHLARILAATDRLIGATGIANIWARDAVALHGAELTLEEAFPGRVLVGLGVSHRNLVEDLRGHHYRRPLRAMADYLAELDRSPYTAVRPTGRPPRLLGALGPRMLALAAARADGAHTYLGTPEHTALARDLLGADRLLCPEQTAVLETDPGAARERARQFLAVYLAQPHYQAHLRRLGFEDDDLAGGGSDRLVDHLVAWGDVAAIAARVAAHRAAGADHVALQLLPATRRGVPLDAWRAVAPAVTVVAPAAEPGAG
jgi:probable F420-dependent oxidoreductase